MATISGRVIFDRDRNVTVTSGDSGLANIPVVLQNVTTTERLTVLTDSNGNYSFLNVPNGSYRIVEAYGTPGGTATPGNFENASPGPIPQGANPSITAAPNPPAGANHLDAVTPNTLFVTVTGASVTNQNFFNGPVIYTPIETILDPCAVISGGNLINAADKGTFGTFPQGTPANTGAPTEPYPGVTPDFEYVLPNPDIYAPTGGQYTVQNILNNALSAEIGAWWRIADHTEGNETGRMMIVNGFNPGAVFFRDTVAVQPNTNYLFTSWILNLFKVTGYPDPELGVRILGENGQVLYSETLGALIPVNTNAPEWKQIGSVINSQNNTRITVEFLSEGPEVIGNDYAIDDVSLNEIQVPVFEPVKTVSSETASVGDTVTFTVILENTCQSPLTNLFFQDTVPNGLTFVPGSVTINGASAPGVNPNAGFSLPNVPGGGTVTVTFQAEVTSVPQPNPALNTADITYSYTPVEGGIPSENTVTSNEVPVLVTENLADVSVLKTAHPSPVQPVGTLTYQIVVSNAGPSDAENVVLTDSLPSILSNPQYSTDGGQTYAPWPGFLRIGQLALGEEQTILIRSTVGPAATGEIINTAIVESTTPDPNLDNNSATAVTPVTPSAPSADLSIQKTACPVPAVRCEYLTYRLTVYNAGPDTAEQIVVSDPLPRELKRAIYSLDEGNTWLPWTGSINVGSLPPHQCISVLVAGIVAPCAREYLKNTALVSAQTPDPNLTNNTASLTVGISCSCQKHSHCCNSPKL